MLRVRILGKEGINRDLESHEPARLLSVAKPCLSTEDLGLGLISVLLDWQDGIRCIDVSIAQPWNETGVKTVVSAGDEIRPLND